MPEMAWVNDEIRRLEQFTESQRVVYHEDYAQALEAEVERLRALLGWAAGRADEALLYAEDCARRGRRLRQGFFQEALSEIRSELRAALADAPGEEEEGEPMALDQLTGGWEEDTGPLRGEAG